MGTDVEEAVNGNPEASDTTKPVKKKPSKAILSLIPVFASVILDTMGVSIVIPVLPYLVKQSVPGGDVLPGLKNFWIGLVFSIYCLAQVVGCTLFGWLSDRIGRRIPILVSIAGSGVGFCLLAAACYYRDYSFIIFARVFSGISGGSIPVGMAYIADVISDKERPKWVGFMGMSIGMSFLLGPVLAVVILLVADAAGASQESQWSSVFFVSAFMCLLAFVVALVLVKDVRKNTVCPSPGDGGEDLKSPIAVVPEPKSTHGVTDDKARQARQGPSSSDDKNDDGGGGDGDGDDGGGDGGDGSGGGGGGGDKASGDDKKEDVQSLGVAKTDRVALVLLLVAQFFLQYSFAVMQCMYALVIEYFWGWNSLELGAILTACGIIMGTVQGGCIKVWQRLCGLRVMTAIGVLLIGCGSLGYPFIEGSGHTALPSPARAVQIAEGAALCVVQLDGDGVLTEERAWQNATEAFNVEGFVNMDATKCAQQCQASDRIMERVGTVEVGFFNTSSGRFWRNKTFSRTDRCSTFVYEGSSCAWLHPYLDEAMGQGPGGQPLPYCHPSWLEGDVHNNVSRDERLSLYDHQYQPGPNQPGWIVLHFCFFFIFTIGYALSNTGNISLIMANSAAQDQGRNQGTNQSVASAAQGVAPFISGLLLDLSPRVLGNFTLPFLVGAIPCLLVFWTPLVQTSKVLLATATPYRENAVKVTVPKDAKEGDPLGYVGTDSKMYQCVVPAGVSPGQRFVAKMSD